jgi:hypothetical protein
MESLEEADLKSLSVFSLPLPSSVVGVGFYFKMTKSIKKLDFLAKNE